MKNQICLLSLLLLLVGACSKSESSEAGRTPGSNDSESEVDFTVPNPVPAWQNRREKKLPTAMAELIKACALTEGAKIDLRSSTCECSPEKNRTARVFVPNSNDRGSLGGKCLSLKSENPDSTQFRNHFRWSLNSPKSNLMVFFQFPKGNDPSLQRSVDQYLEQNQFHLIPQMRASNSFMITGFNENFIVRVGDDPLVVSGNGLFIDEYTSLFEYRVPGTFNREDVTVRSKFRMFYASNAEELSLTLGNLRFGRDTLTVAQTKLLEPPADLPLSETETNMIQHVQLAYQAYLDSVIAGQNKEEIKYEFHADSGCLGFCTSKRTLKLPEALHDVVSAYEYTSISQGTEAHHLISVKGPANTLGEYEAHILLNRAGVVSLIALIESAETENSRNLKIRIFNRNWKELSPKQTGQTQAWVKTLNENKNSYQQKLRSPELNLRNLNAGDIPVVICEDQFDQTSFESKNLLDRLLVGPQNNSVYGWAKINSKSDETESFGTQDWLGWSSWKNNSYSVHSIAMVKNALEYNSQLRAIPFSSEHCTSITPNDIDTFNRLNAHVINFSYVGTMQEASCRENEGKKLYDLTKKNQLWVLAAGNNGTDIDNEPTNWICPQSYLSGKENALIVAGVQDGNLWRDSDRGNQYADIAADASYGQIKGTSFAAPRVSGVASTIFARYPTLNPSQVRLAILAGADIPGWNARSLQPLAVRSGGTLNADKAYAAAGVIASGETSLRNILRTAQCSNLNSNGCFAQVRKQQALLIKNRAVL